MSIKPTEYRCSCCNQVKPKEDQHFVPWDLSLPEEQQTKVAICGECFGKLQDNGCKDVALYRLKTE